MMHGHTNIKKVEDSSVFERNYRESESGTWAMGCVIRLCAWTVRWTPRVRWHYNFAGLVTNINGSLHIIPGSEAMRNRFRHLLVVVLVLARRQLAQYGTRQLKCDGTHAETRFRLSAKLARPFISAGASGQSTTGSRGSRGQLKCDDTHAETRFRLSAKRTRPFT